MTLLPYFNKRGMANKGMALHLDRKYSESLKVLHKVLEKLGIIHKR